ncbi:hypothetical protein ABGB07_39935 [Micromonosporaceae bacterium B7E4]
MTTAGTAVPATDPASPAGGEPTADTAPQSMAGTGAGSKITAKKAGPAKKTAAQKTTAAKKTAAARKATTTTRATAKKAAAATAAEPASTDSGEKTAVPSATAPEAATPSPSPSPSLSPSPSASGFTNSAVNEITAPADAGTTEPTSTAGLTRPVQEQTHVGEQGAQDARADSAASGAPGESTAYPVGTPNAIVAADRAASGRTPGPQAQPSTIRQIFDHPGYAPELLALAAVRGLGPEAGAWAAWVRAAYPGASAEGLVRMATRRYVRLAAAGGALSTATGVLAPLAELAAVTWAQAGLVLHLAAAYDHDPSRPERAADLLVLTRVHPDVPSARAALAAAEAAIAGRREDPGPAIGGGSTENVDDVDAEPGRLAEAGWRLGAPIVARTANWLALRLAVRRLPGAMTLAAAMLSSANTERLAARTVGYYRSAAGWSNTAGRPAVAVEGEPPGYNQSNHSGGSSA